MALLNDLLVLDFSQFLAGPSAALRLADLGARVIKIERPQSGDNCRRLSLDNQWVDGDSLLFHTINRNKESITLDLKNDADKNVAYALIKKADVLIENNRPGIMKKLQLDYATIKKLNPRLVYASVTGYGPVLSWEKKPGQDLLAQSISGLTYLNGNQQMPPTPFALSVADSFAGIHLAEGVMAALIQREQAGIGSHVEISLLESVLSIQFEVLTSYLNDGNIDPVRAKDNNAHAYLAAPYGIYQTKDSYIAIAMGSLTLLGEIIDLPILSQYDDDDSPFTQRDEIKALLSQVFLEKETNAWLTLLDAQGYWSAPVYNWQALRQEAGYQVLNMEQTLQRNNASITTTQCPIKVNGKRPRSQKAAPSLGEDSDKIFNEFMIGADHA